MQRLNSPQAFRDQTIDPGPDLLAAFGVAAFTARQLLAVAVDSGQLTAPAPVVRALAAHREVGQLRLAHATDTVVGGLRGFTARVAADILAGRELPDDLGTAALEASLEGQRHQALSEHLDGLRNQLATAVPQVLREHQDELLAPIRDQVERLHGQMRATADTLAGLDLAVPEAIAEATEAQREAIAGLPDLARAYNRARLLQVAVYLAPGRDAPGSTQWSAETGGWTRVLKLRLYEFRAANLNLLSGVPVELDARARMLALAARTDLWTPTHAELHARMAHLAPPPASPKGLPYAMHDPDDTGDENETAQPVQAAVR